MYIAITMWYKLSQNSDLATQLYTTINDIVQLAIWHYIRYGYAKVFLKSTKHNAVY